MTDTAAPRRGVDVLNTSVTEVMLLAIFFILLAFAFARDELIGSNTDKDSLTRQLANLQDQVKDLGGRLEQEKNRRRMTKAELDKELLKTMVIVEDLSRKNEQLWKQLVASKPKLAAALSAAEAERNKLKSVINPLGSIDDLRRGIEAVKRIAAANNIESDAPLGTVVSAIETLIGKLAREADTLRQTMKAAGVTDKEMKNTAGDVITASCWKRDNGRPDAVFKIFMRSNSFRVTPAWRKVRDPDARNSKAILAMAAAGTLGIQRFKQIGRDIRNESEKRKPPCIFVAEVIIDDRDKPSAAQFKGLRDIAGQYFYIR